MEMELLPSLFIFTIVFFPQQAMSVPHNSLTDLESLLSFKSHVTDPSGFLETNWTTNVSFCSWAGVYCSHERQRVVALRLANYSLQGTISPLLSNLSFLSYLDLSNNTLTGSIPHTIGRLRRLANLNLCQNFLSGPIPSSVFNMSSLTDIYLCNNHLTDTLPSSNDSSITLPLLRRISLSYNQLTGSIPSSFSRSSDVEQLILSNNGFTGSIPGEIGNLSKLSLLYLGTNNLGGKIPTSLGNLSKLLELDTSFNGLDGEIPEELGNLRHLQYLNLGVNRLHGPIPTKLLNASDLYFLQLCENNLVGPVPDTLGKSLPLLTILNMRQNQLTGGLDFIASLSNCRNLVYLIMSGNNIEGALPDSVGNLSSNLQYFRIQMNTIKGKIPAGFANLSNLILLDLEWNKITGELPPALARLKMLQGMYLGHARISGSVPSELGSMASVTALFLEDNMLSGAIPDSLGNISGLQYLSLASNKLSTGIPNSLWSLGGLLELNLSGNALKGSLPLLQVSNLKSLDILDLSLNRLSGKISNGFDGLQMLTRLDLSSNSFGGVIPQSLGGLINVRYLNLSNNFLSGVVPESLANLKHLDSLDLSFNKLEGEIPDGRVFSNASISSLFGNIALCGAPQLGFSPCSSASVPKTKLHLLKYVLPPTACILLLACFFLLLIFRRKHREAKTSPFKDASLNNLRAISHYELIRATDNFSDANLLGRGGMSSAFKARLDDGFLVAVKVLNVEVMGGSRSFDAECRALSVVRHRNLIKIISTCCNLDFKALILPFMPNGSLENQLYSRKLNLLQRINIMVDVALAMEYLHHDHPEIVVHRDLKPSNVLLDEDMVAHVSDFGISKLMLGDSVSHLSTCMPGTIGYIAPEYGSTANVSTAGDVYSFGILMLETFTRKRPSDPMFDGELSLRQWVSKAYPAAVLEVVDCDLLREGPREEEEQPEHLADHVNRFLSSLMGLGLMCSRGLPQERVSMREVVPILQDIKREYSSSFYIELEAKNTSSVCVN